MGLRGVRVRVCVCVCVMVARVCFCFFVFFTPAGVSVCALPDRHHTLSEILNVSVVVFVVFSFPGGA